MKKCKTKRSKSISPISSNVQEALIKVALGYEVEEVVEEYNIVGDELKLVKKKVNKKTYPPDLDAIELALNNGEGHESNYSLYSDEELIEEKHNLAEMLRRLKKEQSDENN